MSRTSKYQKTKGYWVYAHITPEKDVYIGMSKRQPYQRWKASLYKETALQQYIERFGWENIEHRVLIDDLTKSQAEKIEDWFITQIAQEGFCINRQRSGGYCRDNPKEYKKDWHKANREERLEQMKVYRESHRDDAKAYREAHKEERLEYQKVYNKQRRSTPEGKIYNRVNNYNQYHPNLAIETPLEAKKKYLDWGYIPNYIKHDDLI